MYNIIGIICKCNMYMIFKICIIRIYIFVINISFATNCLYVSTNCVNCQIPIISRKLLSLAQHLFNEMHVRVSDAVQFVFVESFSNRRLLRKNLPKDYVTD